MKQWHEVMVMALAVAVPIMAVRYAELPFTELQAIGADAAQVIGAGGEQVVFVPSSARRGEMLLNALAAGLALKLVVLGRAEFMGHTWSAERS